MEEEYLQRLEDERKKMEVFGRELPLSLHLISQAIDAYKAQLPGKKKFVEVYQADSVERPVLAEFLPLRPTEGEDQEEEEGNSSGDNSSEKKMDWLRCAQLGNSNNNNQYSNSHTNHHDMRGWNYGVAGGGRKIRRCWSSELHRRFIDALKQLGGAHVATPKHIRELMKVDGLTNDEVKSHLQKYRLHERRPSPTTSCSSPLDKTTTHAPPTVVIWMPQTGYATLPTTTVSSIDLPMNQAKVQSNKVYTSIPLGSQNSNPKKQNGSPKGPFRLGNYLTSYDSTSPSTSL